MPYFARIEEMELLFLKTRARGNPAEKPSKFKLNANKTRARGIRSPACNSLRLLEV
jgi:hypothetical protein